MDLASADIARTVGAPSEAIGAATALNAFGIDLYRRVVAEDPGADALISPASIALALAMARAGARGQTATEMDRVMRGLGADDRAAGLAALDAALGARSERLATPPFDGRGPLQVTLRIVNAPFAQLGLALEDGYLEALASRFAAGLRLVDFRSTPDEARRRINGWVLDQTEQRIPELITHEQVTAATRLVLVNAIYLKAAWSTPFPEHATAPGPFRRLDGSTREVQLMGMKKHLQYGRGRDWRAVQLPYVGGKLAMLIVVPSDLPTFEAALDETGLRLVTDALRTTEVRLLLPRFGTATQLDLVTGLAALGMPRAFSGTADLSGISRTEPLAIGAVVHQATIDVDEHGTEAAAATAVTMAPTAMPPTEEPIVLTVDRPFLYALLDLETSAILFLGRVTDPVAERS